MAVDPGFDPHYAGRALGEKPKTIEVKAGKEALETLRGLLRKEGRLVVLKMADFEKENEPPKIDTKIKLVTDVIFRNGDDGCGEIAFQDYEDWIKNRFTGARADFFPEFCRTIFGKEITTTINKITVSSEGVHSKEASVLLGFAIGDYYALEVKHKDNHRIIYILTVL